MMPHHSCCIYEYEIKTLKNKLTTGLKGSVTDCKVGTKDMNYTIKSYDFSELVYR